MTTTSAGINGFGRFGLHLLRYWFVNRDSANFSIDFINDENLTTENVAEIISSDLFLDVKSSISVVEDKIVLDFAENRHSIRFTNQPATRINWLGQPTVFFECSGLQTSRDDWSDFLIGQTKRVLISATSWTADELLVFGFNHRAYTGSSVISYGSCTVNAFVPLASTINEDFGIEDCDVNVIHNVPSYRLREFDSLWRKDCTLQEVAPAMLPFLNEQNLNVNYTLVPYAGVSIIDFRFRLKSLASKADLQQFLTDQMRSGSLSGLYNSIEKDEGPEAHKFSPFSAVIVEPSISMRGNNVYMQAYFDNENSVNRFFDVAKFLCDELAGTDAPNGH